MKADLYVQGHYCTTIDVPGDSVLALLAKGMITGTNAIDLELTKQLEKLDKIECSIHLRYRGPVTYHLKRSNETP